jgi:beta-lactamase regulating signal transducer with metallopeptidase domain
MIRERLLWTLAHSLWEVALVAIAAAVTLRLLSRGRAEARYAVGAGAMLTMLAAPLLTFIFHAEAASLFLAALRLTFWMASFEGELLQTGTEGIAPLLTAVSGWIVPFWMVGVTFGAVRLATAWQWTRSIARVAVEAAPGEMMALFDRVQRELSPARPARLLLSDRVDAPAAVGWRRPAVLLPVSAITGLDPDLLRAIFAHELAHIRRHDFAINILQTCVESLLFYHPAMWWLSRRVRAEREHCCDDIAARLCGDTAVYARALLALEHARGDAPAVAMAAGGNVRARILRLLGRRVEGRGWGEALGLTTLILAVAIGGVWKTPPVQAGPHPVAVELPPAPSSPVAPTPAFVEAPPEAPLQALLSAAVSLAKDPSPPTPETGVSEKGDTELAARQAPVPSQIVVPWVDGWDGPSMDRSFLLTLKEQYAFLCRGRGTRRESRTLPGGGSPALTIVSDAAQEIRIRGKEQRDFSMQYCGSGDNGITLNGNIVSLNLATPLPPRGLLENSGAFFLEAPANARTVIHSNRFVDIRNMSGPVRVATVSARAQILNTTGQVDAEADMIDFAASRGRVTLSARSHIQLAMTTKFDGTLDAWARHYILMLVPAGFQTPFKAIVNRAEDFDCRADLCSKVQLRKEGPLFVFTYPGDGSTEPERVSLHAERTSLPGVQSAARVVILGLSDETANLIQSGPSPKQ